MGVAVIAAAIVVSVLPARANVWELESSTGRVNDCGQPGQTAQLVAQGLPFSSAYPPRGRGALIRGEIAPRSGLIADADCYEFFAAVDDRVHVFFVNDAGLVRFDPVMELANPSAGFSMVKSSDDEGPSLAPSLEYRATASGLWKVRVKAADDVASFRYAMVLATTSPSDSSIQELSANNDAVAVAELLPSPGSGPTDFVRQAPSFVTAKAGSLSSVNDVDVFRVEVPNSEWISAAIYDEHGGQREDLTLSVSAGATLYADEDSGPLMQPQVTTGPASGNVFLTVSRPRIPELDWLNMQGRVDYRLVVAVRRPDSSSCGLIGIEIMIPLLLCRLRLSRRRGRNLLQKILLLAACALTSSPAWAGERYEGSLWHDLIQDGYKFVRSPGGTDCVAPVWVPSQQTVREYGISEYCSPKWEQKSGKVVELAGSLLVVAEQSETTIVLELLAPNGETWTHADISESDQVAYAWPQLLSRLAYPGYSHSQVWDGMHTAIQARAESELGVQGYLVIVPAGPPTADVVPCWSPVRRFPVRARFITR